MTDLAEVIDVLRGHARSSTCTLEPRDCAALVAALERVRVEEAARAVALEQAKAEATARAVKIEGIRNALNRFGSHGVNCQKGWYRAAKCTCGLAAVFEEASP